MSAESLLQDDICFEKLLLLKMNRNNKNVPMKGLGVKKLQDLMRAGVLTGRELLDFDDYQVIGDDPGS